MNDSEDDSSKLVKAATATILAVLMSVAWNARVNADTILATDDGVVRNNLCVGTNCSNTPNFFDDTLLLQDVLLRISFNDSSNFGTFPSNNWRIIINDLDQGGDDYFAIQDSTAGTVPFRIDAGLPKDSLRVSSAGVSIDGRLGIDTATPVTELHMRSGDSPTLRLEQDGSNGFIPQTWDIRGNEAQFEVRDRSSGETPFQIGAGVPSSSLVIQKPGGDVGIGTANPAARLHVAGAVIIDGDVSMGSSRTLKHELEAISVEAALDDLLRLPLYRWKYKDDALQAAHLGPMAEDFHSALGVGRDNRHISPTDSAGLALAAIQGLNERFEERVAELLDSNTYLAAENAALLARLVELEKAVAAQLQPVSPDSGISVPW